YLENDICPVEIIQRSVQTLEFEPESFDLIICVNALYAIHPQRSVLRKVHTWLKPTGKFFVIDFGRKQRTIDWAIYLFRESMKRRRVGTYMKALLESHEIIKQNRRSTRGQMSGRYWTHSTTEFGNVLRDCGFTVDELATCYRGYADLAICRK
ncbi:MAG: methyltransferase domain-containing protein, partial [Phycisphaerae bacterium]|nr:methyltransferase domain-containing protein [Phycisphaerae bacterium]